MLRTAEEHKDPRLHCNTDPHRGPPSGRHDLKWISQCMHLGMVFTEAALKGTDRCCQLSSLSAWAMEGDGSRPTVCYSADIGKEKET